MVGWSDGSSSVAREDRVGGRRREWWGRCRCMRSGEVVGDRRLMVLGWTAKRGGVLGGLWRGGSHDFGPASDMSSSCEASVPVGKLVSRSMSSSGVRGDGGGSAAAMFADGGGDVSFVGVIIVVHGSSFGST